MLFKVARIIILLSTLLLFGYLIFVNTTPGHYRNIGCNEFIYTTDEALKEKQNAESVKGGCVAVVRPLNIIQHLGLLLNNLDFYK